MVYAQTNRKRMYQSVEKITAPYKKCLVLASLHLNHRRPGPFILVRGGLEFGVLELFPEISAPRI